MTTNIYQENKSLIVVRIKVRFPSFNTLKTANDHRSYVRSNQGQVTVDRLVRGMPLYNRRSRQEEGHHNSLKWRYIGQMVANHTLSTPMIKYRYYRSNQCNTVSCS